MSEEKSSRRKYKRLKQVRGGHRGVTTKLIKEADELLSAPPLTPEAKSRLHVINKQLSLKSSYLNNLDSEVLDLCEVSDIAGEVDEAEVITAKIIECQFRIEQCMKGNATRYSQSARLSFHSYPTDYSSASKYTTPQVRVVEV